MQIKTADGCTSNVASQGLGVWGAVGGVDTSLHRCYPKPTCAIDFYCQDLQKAYDLARNTNLFNEVIWYKNKGFMHLGLDRNQKGNYYMVN